MNSQEIKKKIDLAHEAVDEIQDKELKTTAFGVVLKFLLTTSLPNHSERYNSPNEKSVPDNSTHVTPLAKTSSVLSSLSITQEQLSEIYEVDGDNLKLRVKVNDAKNSEQQRKIAHVMLFGYKAILDIKEVKGSQLLAVAKVWDIPTDHFVQNVKSSEYLQIRNVGTGKDPILSLKPGALNKLVEEIKALAL
jgi:hypothetical protein